MVNKEYIEDTVLVIIPCYEYKEERLGKLKESLKKYDAGFPYVLAISEGKRTAIAHWWNVLKVNYNYKYVLLIDDDIIFTHNNWLKEMMDVMLRETYCGVVGCIVIKSDESIDHCGTILENVDNPVPLFAKRCKVITDKYNPFNFDLKGTYVVFQVAGCCALYNREYFGLPPVRIYLDSGSHLDSELQATVWANGGNIYYCGKVEVIHNTTTDEEKKKLYGKSAGFSSSNALTYVKRWNTL